MAKNTPAVKKVPMRRCIGCMESKPKGELIRIAWYEEHLTLDVTGRAKGRGVYLCPNSSCIELSKKKNAFRRNFKTNIPDEKINEVLAQVLEYSQDAEQ